MAAWAAARYHAAMPDAIVITISDSRSAGRATDESGPAAAECLRGIGLTVVEIQIVPDEAPDIAAAVRAATGRAPVVVTTGGTGIGVRDVTPEALRPMFDKELPGFGEIMRVGSFSKTPLSIISRGGAGLMGRSLVVYLPGSPRGVRECLELVGPAMLHVLKVLTGPGVSCAEMPPQVGP